jgi:uncharacterized membrane protein YfcA
MVYMLLLACGACSGLLAGLLGIGGGFVVVPVLHALLPLLDVDPALVPTVAVATSLAAMVPTAISAVLAQHRKKTLRAEWVRLLGPGVAFGSALGTVGARSLDGAWITIVFALYAGFFAFRLLRQPAVATVTGARRPHWIATLPQWSVGLVIGGFSALAGVGGASLVVPYLLMREAEMRQAAAAASAVGLVSALVAAAGFGLAPAAHAASNGSGSGLIGFVCWPAALAIGTSAIVLAPVGVAASQRMPVGRLRQAFATVLLVVALLAALQASGWR